MMLSQSPTDALGTIPNPLEFSFDLGDVHGGTLDEGLSLDMLDMGLLESFSSQPGYHQNGGVPTVDHCQEGRAQSDYSECHDQQQTISLNNHQQPHHYTVADQSDHDHDYGTQYAQSTQGDDEFVDSPSADGSSFADRDVSAVTATTSNTVGHSVQTTSGGRPRRVAASKRRYNSTSSVEEEAVDIKPIVRRGRKALPVYEEDEDEDEDEKPAAGRRSGAMTKNAIAARENRQKKKVYVTGLEKENKTLRTELDAARHELSSMRRQIEQLTKQVNYNAGIIANQTEIGTVMRQLMVAPGIRTISTSFLPVTATGSSSQDSTASASSQHRAPLQPSTTGGKRKVQDENADQPVRKSGRIAGGKTYSSNHSNPTASAGAAQNGAGICMHMVNGCLSFEFCEHCAQKARKSLSNHR